MKTKITRADISRIADSGIILQRGRYYYRKGRIKSIKDRNNFIEAKVQGSSLYTVTVQNSKKGIFAACTCPYQGENCKHIVAVLYALMNLGQNRQKEPKKQKSEFINLTLGEATSHASLSEIAYALKIIEKKQIDIIDEEKSLATIEVMDGINKYEVSIKYAPSWGKSRPTFWKNCTCKGYSFDNPCVHKIASLLFLLKKYNSSALPKNYEKKIKKRYNLEKYNVLFKDLEKIKTNESPAEEYPEISGKKYKIYFSIGIDEDILKTGLVKATIKKNGDLGSLRKISFIECGKYYNDCPEDMKYALNCMTSPLYNEAIRKEMYYFNGKDMNKSSILEMLEDIYKKHPEYFINCIFAQEKSIPEIKINAKENRKYTISLSLKISGESYDLSDQSIHLFEENELWVYIPTKERAPFPLEVKCLLSRISTQNPEAIYKLRENLDIELSESQLREIIEKNYSSLALIGNIHLPEKYKPEEKQGISPKLRLFLKEKEGSIEIEPKFLYLNNEISASDEKDIVCKEDNRLIKILRDKEEELRLIRLLEKRAEKSNSHYFIKGSPIEWLADFAPSLIAEGCEIFGSDNLLSAPISAEKPKLGIHVSSGIDWFDIKADISFGKQQIPLSDIVNTISSRERWIKLADGSLGAIPKHWIEKISSTIGLLKVDKNNKKFLASRAQFNIIESLAELAETKSLDEAYREMCEKFKNFQGIKDMPLPQGFQGKLRDYQKAGYNWLHFLREFSLGGCLADEMGLGKTVQVLALLLYEKEHSQSNLPSLIVAPTSLIFNWEQEIKKFTPQLKSYIHHRQDRRDKLDSLQQESIDIIITSYETLRNDEHLFEKEKFNYIILDESQKIKNPVTGNAKTIMKLKGKQRLVLTGTPIENSYIDLWSQFSFINPGLLGSHEKFKGLIKTNGNENSQIARLREIIHPFILMRKKSMVAKDLPEKQIDIVYCTMDSHQEKFYNSWKERFQREIKETIEKQGIMKSKIKILEGLMRLRQICNHPMLVDESYMRESAKFTTLLEYIKETLSVGRKALVFSSFVKMLHLIKKELEKEKVPFAYLDGSTRDRESVVRDFQSNDKIKLFLGSLKAGGLGLNLTAAEQVFIVDPWWNPAAEMQAIDRAHRIGQTKNIFVYKMIVKNTIEEKILALQEKKQEMIKEVVFQEKNIFKQLNKEDILQLFS